MSINDLPAELLEHIFSFLSPSEFRKSTLISRRVAETFNALNALNDVWLNLSEDIMDEAEAVISNSNRSYKNVRLNEVRPLEFNSVIWTKLGMDVRKLEIKDCSFGSSEVFYSILHACPGLEALAIHAKGDELEEQWLELPSGVNLQDIQEATRNLRHLHLTFSLDADTLENMLTAMPSVSTIAMSKFEERSDFLDRLPGILGPSRGIMLIDWKPDIGFEERIGELLTIASRTLLDFRAPPLEAAYRGFSLDHREGYEALKRCTMLRHLEITLIENIDDFLLRDVLLNTTRLEVLNLFEYAECRIHGFLMEHGLSHEALMPILGLEKLRELRLRLTLTTRSDSRVSEDFVRGLGKLLSLEVLHLSDRMGAVNHSGFQDLTSLPNLRDLSVGNLRWDADCLRAFPADIKNLRKLSICCPVSADDGAPVLPQDSESERRIIGFANLFKSDRRGVGVKASRLEFLEMEGIPLTDNALTWIATLHNGLEVLKLKKCNNITDVGLVNLLQQEPRLEKLRIFDWDLTDGSFLEALKELCPRLHSLNLQHCAQINRSAVESFKSQRPTVSVSLSEQRLSR